tara:strand:+ start:980 stop:1222 length:243 start_codon:yes stop_codon:yes gene_type:complete
LNIKKQSVVDKKAMDIALETLKRLDVHEKECGERWAEAIVEIRHLRVATDAHSARWEKLAWLVIGSVVATAMVHFVDLVM